MRLAATSGEDGVSALLAFLTQDGCELLMVLGGYFDESEREGADDPICVAGYVFKPGAYRIFAKRWRRFLRSAGLGHLHATDLYAGVDSTYGKFDAKRRAALLARAVELINASYLVGIVAAFNRAEFERMAPEGFAAVNGSIYSSACQVCMRQTAFWLKAHSHYQNVAYVFEAGHKFQHEANAIMRPISSTAELTAMFRYHSHSFVRKEDAAGLQAADLLAWITTRALLGFPQNRTMAMFREPIQLLVGDGSRYQANFFFDHILKQYLEEQREKPDRFYFKKPPEFRNQLR